MAATTLVRARVNARRVRKVTRILDRLGLKPEDVVNLVFAKIEQRQGLPFAVGEPEEDYAVQEYGLTPAESRRLGSRLSAELAAERRNGTIRTIRSADDLR
jgi:antitoxin component of RelBE/YafQ-DinJ toxin-antitoxin module